MKLLFWETCVESTFQLLSDLNIFPTGALIQGGARFLRVSYLDVNTENDDVNTSCSRLHLKSVKIKLQVVKTT